MSSAVAEHNESAWWLAAAPMIWAGHFLVCYGLAAVWCAKLSSASFGTLKAIVVAVSVVALAGLVALGVRGYRRHRLVGGELPHDDDTPEDRHRFLGFAVFLLAGLGGIAVVFELVSVLVLRSCL